MATTEFRSRAEHRWPVVVAIAVAIALYLAVPADYLPWLRFVVAGLAIAILIALVVLNPHRLNREERWSRRAGVALAILLLLANQVAIVQLIVALLEADAPDARGILLVAVQVWVTNIIVYAIVYWELDRGGPVVRRREPRDQLPPASFAFPQDANHDAVAEVASGSSRTADWMPSFFDYVYVSATNSMAFSPTDTMPLTTLAKAIMLVQSVTGFAILALVIARVVNVIGG
ncbi:DUF1345 domain-containing protein [Protaetiibacter larvae]|uniref:DUF1345 domain-containing protein n=1 Tax=Protaetiibacter larvae TaxID=2592654 RepID=A0A5C1Y8B1_9MICO|nr:DUF1345 domain-containing protein [Protaetiibacter larvae]QEO10214.1 DUF1345 domain-containing protein [Protaetiibacter larvae]